MPSPHKSFTFYALLFFLTLLLSACTPAIPTPTATAPVAAVPISTARHTATPSHTPTVPSTATKRPASTPTFTPTPSLTPTQTPDWTPTNSPTPPTLHPFTPPTPTPLPPLPPLTIRYPSIEDLEAYLLPISPEYFHAVYENDKDYLVQDWRTWALTNSAELIYADVNGDGAEDLVVADYLLAAVFLWNGNTYATPFLMIGSTWKYAPSSHTYLQDYTNDSIPEIIFDYRGDSGGTSVRYDYWTRYIIHCQQQCWISWKDSMGYLTDQHNSGGMFLRTADLQLSPSDPPTLQHTEESFSIYDIDLSFNSTYPLDSLVVFTSTQTLFEWNGATFEQVNVQILEPSYEVDARPNLTATNQEGITVQVKAEPNRWLGQENDVCELYWNEKLLTPRFGCKNGLTTVQWLDITNDGEKEIVILTFSGKWPTDTDSNQLSDIDCVHQRFLAYQWLNTTAIEIANVAGCVVRSDLYGVRMEDLEGDGQVEIIVADSWFTEPSCYESAERPYLGCWYEFGYHNLIYRWNGSQFAPAGELTE